MKKKSIEFKPPIKKAKSLDEIHPGISKYPSREYFERRDVNDIPGYPRENYFSMTWRREPYKKIGRKKRCENELLKDD